MKHLRTTLCYFVFYRDEKKTLTLLDHRYFMNRIEVSEFVSACNETSEDEYRGYGYTTWPVFSFLQSRDIKTRPEYLQAFRNYFGDSRLEFEKNRAGRVIGIRFEGIPKDYDLRNSDLRLIADGHESAFVPPGKLLPQIRKKVV